MKLRCEWCGRVITKPKSAVERSEHHFCSLKCRSEWQTGPNHPHWRGGGVELTCDQCRAPITRKKSRVEKYEHHFCSRKCYSEWQSERQIGPNNPRWQGGGVELTCDQCGAPITRKKAIAEKYEHHFCSRKCYSEWLSEWQTGPDHPHWQGGGVRLTCNQCGAPITRPKAEAEKRKHHFCSPKCQGEWQSEWLTGPNSPRWRGGVSFEPYPPEFNEALKRRIRERDKHTCALCGGYGQHVHHIDSDKGSNDEMNLITLCARCHGRVTARLKEWEPYLRRVMKSRYS